MNIRRNKRRVPARGRVVQRQGSARHVQARLDMRASPREQRAVDVYDRLLKTGWSQRDIIVEGLLSLDDSANVPASAGEMLLRHTLIQLSDLFEIGRALMSAMQAFRSGEIDAQQYQTALEELDSVFAENASDMFANFEGFE